MGYRRGPTPLRDVPEFRSFLRSAKIFDARNAANRARAELLTAIRLLDEVGAPVHKFRLAAAALDDARDDMPIRRESHQ